MRRIFIISTIAIAVVAGAVAGSVFGTTSAGDTSSTRLSMYPTIGTVTIGATLDPVDEDVVSWAQDRFREAGLSLPDMHVSFHSDKEVCEGGSGGHLMENGQSKVLICIPGIGRSRALKVKRVLLHEFAHAWDHFALTDRLRSEFMAFKGFPGWSFEVPYDERASEGAAEILTWGLMDRPILFNSLDGAWSWEERLEGYRILTGSFPPHGYVWSLFAASHDIYAYTPAQVEIVKTAWELSEDEGRLTEWIEVRFSKDQTSCNGAVASAELIDDRLHVQVCPGSESELTSALLNTFTGE